MHKAKLIRSPQRVFTEQRDGCGNKRLKMGVFGDSSKAVLAAFFTSQVISLTLIVSIIGVNKMKQQLKSQVKRRTAGTQALNSEDAR
jgi:hypothetical protein